MSAAGCISSLAEAELAIRRLAGDSADPERELTPAELAAIEAYIQRRRDGDPPHYILGGCEFMGHWIRLDETAYIPRPWTEAMVRRGVASLLNAGEPTVAIDLGTGSGAIARVIADSAPGCHVWGLDIDERSLRWARINTATASNVTVLRSDLFAAIPQELAGHVDLAIGSLPYVPSGEIATLPRDYREHEPMVALDGGPDGLAVDQRALGEAIRWLRPGGVVLLELGHRQGTALSAHASSIGFSDAKVHLDDEGDDAFIECTL